VLPAPPHADGGRERHAADGFRGHDPAGRAAPAGTRAARARGRARAGRQAAGDPLGRPAAARGDRARAGQRPAHPAGRRADREPRLGDRRRHPAPAGRAVGRRQDRGAGHARARRARRHHPHRDAGRRPRGVVIAPRWRKVLRDTFGQRGRSLLAVLAMAAGVFEITTMVHEYALLEPALHGMYARTRPASATLLVDRVSDALVDSVRCMPGVGDAEARPVIVARVRVGPDEWVPARLQVVRDFGAQRLDTFEPDHGAWPPGPDDVLLERTALRVAKVGIGATLALRIEGTADRSVRVAGTVHAAGLPPAWMEHMVPGFVAWNSSLREGGVESAQIRMVVADHPLEEGHIREVADSVRTRLERLGHTVTRVTVPPPGRHPHADQMEAFLFLLLAFGVLSFALSAVLVASMMHALMAEQVRQVGMMKAIGATDRQVAGLYLGQIALLAAGALIVGVPPGLLAGRTFAVFAAGVLNTDVSGAPFPLWGVAVVAFIGFVVPPLVALGPVRRAARIPVREALADDPPAPRLGGRRMRGLEGLAWLPRPLRLTL